MATVTLPVVGVVESVTAVTVSVKFHVPEMAP